jgi:serine/threonine-protein kinase
LALERAHEAGVVHRDIKPGNVYLSQDNLGQITVKLVDFGIAKVRSETLAPENELTQTGSLLGTPTYMSPEQARGLRSIDHRADLWALAVVLYRMLCNRVPHPMREGLGLLILEICTQPAPPIQQFAPWVPTGVAQILDRALQLDIARRYQSAAEFRADIERMLGGSRALSVSMLRSLTEEEKSKAGGRYRSVYPPPLPRAIDQSSTQASAAPMAMPTVSVPRTRSNVLLGAMVALAVIGVGSALVMHAQSAPPMAQLSTMLRSFPTRSLPARAPLEMPLPAPPAVAAEKPVNSKLRVEPRRAAPAATRDAPSPPPEPRAGRVGVVHEFE